MSLLRPVLLLFLLYVNCFGLIVQKRDGIVITSAVSVRGNLNVKGSGSDLHVDGTIYQKGAGCCGGDTSDLEARLMELNETVIQLQTSVNTLEVAYDWAAYDTEVAIGTWIDGKTLYRQVTVTGAVGAGTTTHFPGPAVGSLDSIVSVQSFCQFGTSYHAIPYLGNNDAWSAWGHYRGDTSQYKVVTGTSRGDIVRCFHVMKHTKP